MAQVLSSDNQQFGQLATQPCYREPIVHASIQDISEQFQQRKAMGSLQDTDDSIPCPMHARSP